MHNRHKAESLPFFPVLMGHIFTTPEASFKLEQSWLYFQSWAEVGISHSKGNHTTERPKSKDTWNFKEGALVIHSTHCSINPNKYLKSIRYLTQNIASSDWIWRDELQTEGLQ